jgi:hypothetical protein
VGSDFSRVIELAINQATQERSPGRDIAPKGGSYERYSMPV